MTRPWPTSLVDASHGPCVPWTCVPNRCVQALDYIKLLVVTSHFLGYDRCHISVCTASPLHSYPTYPSIRSACPNGSGHVDYRDVSSKGRIVPGTRRPRDELSKGRNIRYYSFGDTLSETKTTLHPGQLQRLQRQSDVLVLSTRLTSVCTMYVPSIIHNKSVTRQYVNMFFSISRNHLYKCT